MSAKLPTLPPAAIQLAMPAEPSLPAYDRTLTLTLTADSAVSAPIAAAPKRRGRPPKKRGLEADPSAPTATKKKKTEEAKVVAPVVKHLTDLAPLIATVKEWRSSANVRWNPIPYADGVSRLARKISCVLQLCPPGFGLSKPDLKRILKSDLADRAPDLEYAYCCCASGPQTAHQRRSRCEIQLVFF